MPPAGCLPVRGAFGNRGRTEKYEERALLRSKTARRRCRRMAASAAGENGPRAAGTDTATARQGFFGLPPAFLFV